jgi:hypothetical protein
MMGCVLSRLVAFAVVVWHCLAVRFAREPRFAASITVIALAALAVSPAWAQDKASPPQGQSDATPAPKTNAGASKANAIVKTGVRSRVGSAWNCDIPDQPPPVWGRADHGTIEISRGKGPQCGRESMAIAEIFYTSEPGFKGMDKALLLGWLLKGNIDQTYTILVK